MDFIHEFLPSICLLSGTAVFAQSSASYVNPFIGAGTETGEPGYGKTFPGAR